jgi:hypothetical protein
LLKPFVTAPETSGTKVALHVREVFYFYDRVLFQLGLFPATLLFDETETAVTK